MDLSIIIVNYNTKELCTQTVKYVLASSVHETFSYEVIVVDNSSKKEEIFSLSHPNVRIFSGVENHGFGHACNIGASKAAGKILLFLNSDTIVEADTIQKSWDYLVNHPEIGVLGIKTLLQDGSLDHGCKRGFPTPFNSLCYFTKLDRCFPHNRHFGGYRLSYLDPDQTTEVDAVSGAYLMIPKEIFQGIKSFDESFFMYGEDLDLCYRVKQAGYQVVYYAGSTMVHLKGQSGLQSQNPIIIQHFYQAMELFYDKHYKKKYGVVMRMMVHGAIRAKCRWSLLKSSQ